MHVYRLPKLFTQDHWDRELIFEGDWIVHENRNHVFVRLSEEGAHDMLSDADYYSVDTPGWGEGLEESASAKRTLKVMQQQNAMIEETGQPRGTASTRSSPSPARTAGPTSHA